MYQRLGISESLIHLFSIRAILKEAVPTQHSLVSDLTADLTSPTRAFFEQLIFIATKQTLGCSVDLVGIPTAVAAPGNERWLAFFLRVDQH